MVNNTSDLHYFEDVRMSKYNSGGRILYLLLQFQEACRRYILVFFLFFASLLAFSLFVSALFCCPQKRCYVSGLTVIIAECMILIGILSAIGIGFYLAKRFYMKLYIGIRDAAVFFVPLLVFALYVIGGGWPHVAILCALFFAGEIVLAAYYIKVIAKKKQHDLDIPTPLLADAPVAIFINTDQAFRKIQIDGGTRNAIVVTEAADIEFKIRECAPTYTLAIGMLETIASTACPVRLTLLIVDATLKEPLVLVCKVIDTAERYEERGWLDVRFAVDWDTVAFASHRCICRIEQCVLNDTRDRRRRHAAITACFSEPRPEAVKSRPKKILFAVFDAVRHDHVGVYGYRRGTTPCIDRFAQDAMVVRNAFVQGEWTLTSFMSFLTGLYPSSHSVFHPARYQYLHPSIETLPLLLRNNDFITKGFFTHKRLVSNFGFARGFDSHIFRQCNKEYRIANGDDVLEYGIDTLNFHRNDNLFLMLHFFDTHQPCCPPAPYTETFDRRYPHNVIQDVRTYLMHNAKGVFTERDVENLIARYDAEILRLDRRFGLLVDYLKSSGQYDDTMIIFTADHGMLLNDHGDLATIRLFDETLRVPLIIKPPRTCFGACAAPTDSAISQANLDIMPTILEAYGIPHGKSLQGRSLLSSNTNGNGTSIAHAIAISESFFANTYTVSVRSATHRYVAEAFFDPIKPFETIDFTIRTETLYAVRNDQRPAETRIEGDAATLRQYRDIALGHVAKSKSNRIALQKETNR